VRASTSVRGSIAPARPGRLFGGVGKACGPGEYLGGWNAFCSLGICATGASSRTPTDADDEYGGRSEYGRETSCSSCSIFVVACFFSNTLMRLMNICHTLLTCATMALTLSSPPPASAAWISAWAV